MRTDFERGYHNCLGSVSCGLNIVNLTAISRPRQSFSSQTKRSSAHFIFQMITGAEIMGPFQMSAHNFAVLLRFCCVALGNRSSMSSRARQGGTLAHLFLGRNKIKKRQHKGVKASHSLVQLIDSCGTWLPIKIVAFFHLTV